MRQSGLGIASLVLSMVTVVIDVLAFVAAGVHESQRPPPAADEPLPLAIGLVFCGGAGLALVGFMVGLVSFFQPNRKKTLGIIGTVLNGLIVLGVVAMAIIGTVDRHGRRPAEPADPGMTGASLVGRMSSNGPQSTHAVVTAS